MGQLAIPSNRSRLILPFIALLFSFSLAQSQVPADSVNPFEGRISLDCRLTPTQIAVGDTAVYRVQVSWKGPTEDFVFFAPNVPECEGVLFSHMQTISEKRGTLDGVGSNTIFQLHFVGEKPGSGRIGDIQVKYLSRGAKEPEVLSASGRPVTILTPRKGMPWELTIKVTLALVLASVLAVGYSRIKKDRARRAAAPVTKTPLETAMEGLGIARRRILEGDAPGYYNETCTVLKKFLCDADIAGSPGLSVSKLIQAVDGAALDDASKAETKSILTACEEMRFSGFSPEQHDLEIFESRIKYLLRNLSERRTVHGR